MFVNSPARIRSVISIAHFKPVRSLSRSSLRRFENSCNRYPVVKKIRSALFGDVKNKLRTPVFSSTAVFSRLREDKPDMETVLRMTSPADVQTLSEDLSSLSASVTSMNHEAQGLIKVNVDNLESKHSPDKFEDVLNERGMTDGAKAPERKDIDAPDVSECQQRNDLAENVAKLEESFGPDGHVGIIGKAEGRESTPSFKESGRSDRGDVNVVKTTDQNAPSELEENVRELEESFGPDGHVGIIGKTEGMEFVPKFRGHGKPGKLQEGVEGNASEISNQNVSSELEENVRKLEESFGPDGHVGIVGKTEGKEFVSPSDRFVDSKQPGTVVGENKSDVGKVDESAGEGLWRTVGSGKIHDNKIAMAEQTLVQNSGNNEDGVVSEHETGSKGSANRETNVLAEDKVTGRAEASSSGDSHDGHVKFIIKLYSKSSEEAEYISKLINPKELQLPDGTVLIGACDATDTTVSGEFNVELYFETLPTSKFGRFMLYSPLIPSTHTLLSQNFHSFPTGTVCVAGAQLQGKGRGGNAWQSPEGCLMFSFTTQMTSGHLVPFLQYVVSLAVLQGVDEICKTLGLPAPALRIKWPNDLYAKGLKVGGVLCTSSYRAKTFNITVGVGLNVGNREPTTCLDTLIQELDGASPALQREELLAAIMSNFEKLNNIFQDQGFLPMQNAYYDKWLHSGQSVTLEERKPGSSNVLYVPVTIQGLTSIGYLLATDSAGEQYELHPDGNSFDFLKGLVRQKLPPQGNL